MYVCVYIYYNNKLIKKKKIFVLGLKFNFDFIKHLES